MRLDVFVSENNKAIMLGSCDVLLSELVFTERMVADSLAHKTAVIERFVNILPAPGFIDSLSDKQSLGQLRIKMRMRKPISEAMRFHREMGEVRDNTRAV